MSAEQAPDVSTAPEARPTPPPGLLTLWREDVRCVFERDPAARTAWEVLTPYPGVHAILIHRVSHRLWRHGWRYAGRLLAYLARLLTDVDIHPGARIGRRFFIDHGAGVVIGETAEIGDEMTLYPGVTLGGTTWNEGKRHPTLGNGVLVGAGAKMLGPITLGDNVRVGANSVVVKDVPRCRTVVGIPGKIIQGKPVRMLDLLGIDLSHHLISDPVGRAISCLLERLEALESQLAQGRGETAHADPACPTREAGGHLLPGARGYVGRAGPRRWSMTWTYWTSKARTSTSMSPCRPGPPTCSAKPPTPTARSRPSCC